MTDHSAFSSFDPRRESCDILLRISAIVESTIPERRASLSPLLREASVLLDRLAKRGREDPAEVVSTEVGADDSEMVREQLQKVLDDLEDLCEVYFGVHAIPGSRPR